MTDINTLFEHISETQLDYALPVFTGTHNTKTSKIKKPLTLAFVDDESGIEARDRDEDLAEAKTSTERVRKYYKRHPKKVRKYLRDTVKDRAARNRDRKKAVKKYGKSKMKNHDVHHPNGARNGNWRLAKKDHGRDKKNENVYVESVYVTLDEMLAGNVPNESWTLLAEGGAAGHMAHPYEDDELTFRDVKEMVHRGLVGQLDQEAPVTEKLDGQNIAFTIKDGTIRFARNKGHVKNAGERSLDVTGIRSMFAGRGNIERAFAGAAEDLESAVARLTPAQQLQLFGGGTKFMNVEVIFPDTKNVIPYDKAVLVFHGTIAYDTDGIEVGRSLEDASTLSNALVAVNADRQKTFGISGPRTIVFDDASTVRNKRKLQQHIRRIQRLQQEYGLDDTDTIEDYKRTWWSGAIDQMGFELTDDEREGLIGRWATGDKSFRITDIEDTTLRAKLKRFENNNLPGLQRRASKVLEQTFLQVGVDAMHRVTNFLAANNPIAARQLKQEVLDTIRELQQTDDQNKLAKLQQQVERLENLGVDNIVPSEGLVFIYNGKPYKFTGTFAPVNQILGTLKFEKGEATVVEPTDIKSVADKLQFTPVTKKPVKYSEYGEVADSSALDDMEPMTFATVTSAMKVVTITADGKETENTAVPGDIIMSGPSGEKYVVKATKFGKLYTPQADGTVIPEQSPRQVARYTGKDDITFTAPWGEQMILKPGDYVVQDGEGYYRVAKKEYDVTYNSPEEASASTPPAPSTPSESSASSRRVAIFAGRFQPFHAGHYSVYESLVTQFGKDNVYIASSDVTDPIRSPFAFRQKQQIITTMFDVPRDRVVQVKNPYAPEEILRTLPPDTAYVTAVSQKDAERLGQSGGYFRPFDPEESQLSHDTAGYFIVAPEFQLNVNGKNVSGTQLRAVLGNPQITDRAKKEIFTQVYGKFDRRVFDLVVKKTSESDEARELTQQYAATPKKKKAKTKTQKTTLSTQQRKRAQDTLRQRITNPETKRKIYVGTALSYPKDHPARRAAQQLLQRALKETHSVI